MNGWVGLEMTTLSALAIVPVCILNTEYYCLIWNDYDVGCGKQKTFLSHILFFLVVFFKDLRRR